MVGAVRGRGQRPVLPRHEGLGDFGKWASGGTMEGRWRRKAILPPGGGRCAQMAVSLLHGRVDEPLLWERKGWRFMGLAIDEDKVGRRAIGRRSWGKG